MCGGADYGDYGDYGDYVFYVVYVIYVVYVFYVVGVREGCANGGSGRGATALPADGRENICRYKTNRHFNC